MSKHVCLDPGHYSGIAGKRSPDGTYAEHEFNLDMARRLKSLLEEQGIAVTLTRIRDENVTLRQRVKIANAIKNLDLFFSIHTNAAGNSGWYDAKGLIVYTSQAGEAAGRNIAAKKILVRMKEAGVTIRGAGIAHSLLYVLRYTTAPAVLVEHGFHTNREETALLKTHAYRQKLAEADAKGICDFLGVTWREDGRLQTEGQKEETPEGTESETENPISSVSALKVAEAVRQLAAAGVITTPDYWTANAYSTENVHHLLVKMAAALQ